MPLPAVIIARKAIETALFALDRLHASDDVVRELVRADLARDLAFACEELEQALQNLSAKPVHTT